MILPERRFAARIAALALVGILLAACANQASPVTPEVLIVTATAVPTDLSKADPPDDQVIAMLFTQTAVAITIIVQGPTAQPSSTPLPDPASDPATAAQAWYSAIFNSDGITLSRYTCATFVKDSNTVGFTLGAILGGINNFSGRYVQNGAVTRVDVTDVQFHTVSSDGQQALVQSDGKLRAAVGGAGGASNVSDTFQMHFEEGGWKVCDWQIR